MLGALKSLFWDSAPSSMPHLLERFEFLQSMEPHGDDGFEIVDSAPPALSAQAKLSEGSLEAVPQTPHQRRLWRYLIHILRREYLIPKSTLTLIEISHLLSLSSTLGLH